MGSSPMKQAVVLLALGIIVIYMFMSFNMNPTVEPIETVQSGSQTTKKKNTCELLGRDMESKYESKLVFPPPPKTYRSCKEIAEKLLSQKPPEVKAPSRFPENLQDDFTLNGQVPVVYDYHKNIYNGETAMVSKWTAEAVTELKKKVADRVPLHYPRDTYSVYKSMDKWSRDAVRGKSGIVIGSEDPWVESILLEYGAKHVTTIEYGKIESLHPQISTLLPSQSYNLLLEGKWEPVDFAFSFSSIEHSGLGRYGDPIDPTGDLEAVQQISCLVKPGGFFFLGFPAGGDCLVFNAHRVYGPKRLEKVFDGWHVLDMVVDTNHADDIALGDTTNPCALGSQPVFVMQNLRGCPIKN